MAYSFCVKCGSKENVVNGLCQKCRLENLILPSLPPLTKCKYCSLFFINNRWQKLTKEVLQNYLKKNFKKYSPSLISYSFNQKTNSLTIKISLQYEGEKLFKELQIPLKTNICDNCMKLRSDYYEAKIQLRGTFNYPKSPEIVKTEKTKNGVDLFFLTKKKAFSYAKNFRNFEKKYSSSLVGLTSSGKPKKKYTILLRKKETQQQT